MHSRSYGDFAKNLRRRLCWYCTATHSMSVQHLITNSCDASGTHAVRFMMMSDVCTPSKYSLSRLLAKLLPRSASS